jgi:hypothetical protein
LHRHIPIPVAERLANGIALVVVTAARKSEELGIKIGQPVRPFRQKNLACLEFRRGDRHSARLIPDRLYGYDSGDHASQLLNERSPRACVFDKNTLRVPSPSEFLRGRL